jgi:hypothetical protein
MLLVNGEKDTQQPISDLYLMMKHGDPKDTWVNPAGGIWDDRSSGHSRASFRMLCCPGSSADCKTTRRNETNLDWKMKWQLQI